MIENQTLIWRLRQGSFEALARIYEKYEALLVTIAATILQDQAAAEDVVHDCFVKLAQEPHKVGLVGSLKHYLVVCVSNRARDQLRGRRARASALSPPKAEMPGPVQIALRSEQQQRLWQALGKLNPDQREVVVLYVTAGLKFRQIAADLGISINTAQSRYRYGLAKLRENLNGDLEP